ncbi:MAG: hypothetical protein WC595_05460 [Candidatus Nanoarchaeia archaeon]
MHVGLIPLEEIKHIQRYPTSLERARGYEHCIERLSTALEDHYDIYGWPAAELHLADLQLFNFYCAAFLEYTQAEAYPDLPRLEQMRMFDLEARGLTLDQVMQHLAAQVIDKENPVWLKF